MKKTVQGKKHSARRQTVKADIWLSPLEKAELVRVAESEGLSISQTGRTFITDGLRRKLHEQNETLLYPSIRQAVHEEVAVLGDRIVFYLMTNAMSSERGTILIANALKWIIRIAAYLLKLPEKPADIFNRIKNFSRRQARQNINAHKTTIKKMIEEYEAEPTVSSVHADALEDEDGEDGHAEGE